MAAGIPKVISFGCSSIAIGPNRDVVAELVKKFDVKPVSIAMNDQLKDESSGKEDVSSLNLSTSQDDAPVSLIWNPSEMVAANNRITPQLVFLLITSHGTIPQIINMSTPHKAIIPSPSSWLNKNQLVIIKPIIKQEKRCLILVALFDFAIDLLYPWTCTLSSEVGNANWRTK